MDNLKLLRVQVAAKVAYLESEQAHIDICYPYMSATDEHVAKCELKAKAEICRDILKDIDALESL